MDFVNQSVLQISSQDVEGKRSDKTDFAEKLGAMNRRWQILQGLIAEKVMFQFNQEKIRPEMKKKSYSYFAKLLSCEMFLNCVVCLYFRFNFWKDFWKVG